VASDPTALEAATVDLLVHLTDGDLPRAADAIERIEDAAGEPGVYGATYAIVTAIRELKVLGPPPAAGQSWVMQLVPAVGGGTIDDAPPALAWASRVFIALLNDDHSMALALWTTLIVAERDDADGRLSAGFARLLADICSPLLQRAAARHKAGLS